MVKVLENHLIDLDLLPGTKPADLFAQASALEEKNPDKAKALRALAEQRAAGLMEEVGRKTSGVPLPPEVVPVQQPQGGFVGGVKGVGMGLANTVGALGKGVGDTLGNTVYGLGKGLVDTGAGVVGGLAQTGKSAVGAGGQEQTAGIVEPSVGAFEPVEEVEKLAGESDEPGKEQAATDSGVDVPTTVTKAGPRKIEIRSGKIEDVPPLENAPELEGASTDDPNLGKFEGVKLVDNDAKPIKGLKTGPNVEDAKP